VEGFSRRHSLAIFVQWCASGRAKQDRIVGHELSSLVVPADSLAIYRHKETLMFDAALSTRGMIGFGFLIFFAPTSFSEAKDLIDPRSEKRLIATRAFAKPGVGRGINYDWLDSST